MLRTEDMIQMKIKSLLAPGGLIAVWCTNSQSHIQDIHEKLFPAWGVSYVATWYWLKVDRSGTPVSICHQKICFHVLNTYLLYNMYPTNLISR
jgi:N6-adenosine-specific RNA methylase IME4